MPAAIRATRRARPARWPSEPAVLAELRGAGRTSNRVVTPMIGAGYSGTHTPAVILRNVLESPAWYTAYTPYQPEISQGRLQMLLNFQTVVADLTGLDVAGASLLDESTAAAEAMTLARRQSKAPQDAVFVVDEQTHPQTLAVLADPGRAARPRPQVVDRRHEPTELYERPSCSVCCMQHPGHGRGRSATSRPVLAARARGGGARHRR